MCVCFFIFLKFLCGFAFGFEFASVVWWTLEQFQHEVVGVFGYFSVAMHARGCVFCFACTCAVRVLCDFPHARGFSRRLG